MSSQSLGRYLSTYNFASNWAIAQPFLPRSSDILLHFRSVKGFGFCIHKLAANSGSLKNEILSFENFKIDYDWNQCNPMLELKVAQMFPKVTTKVATAVFTKDADFSK